MIHDPCSPRLVMSAQPGCRHQELNLPKILMNFSPPLWNYLSPKPYTKIKLGHHWTRRKTNWKEKPVVQDKQEMPKLLHHLKALPCCANCTPTFQKVLIHYLRWQKSLTTALLKKAPGDGNANNINKVVYIATLVQWVLGSCFKSLDFRIFGLLSLSSLQFFF